MPNLPRIRTPWIQQWRRLRYQVLPLMIFAGSVAGAMWLWGRHVGLPNAIGEVQAVRADAVALSDGRLVTLTDTAPGLFDRVERGQVIARLNAGPLEAALKTLQEELTGLEKELEATRATILQDQQIRRQSELAEERRLTETVERLQLDILDREALVKTDKIELSRLNETLVAIENLVKKGVEPEIALVKARAERDVVEERIRGNEDSLKEARAQMEQSKARLAKFAQTRNAELEELLAPLRAAVRAQENRVKETELQVELLTIRAPMDGTITAIHAWPGQNVRAGTPIMTLASSDGRCIVSYVRQEMRIRPVVGMPVDVSVRSLPRKTARARVEEVGPQVEPVPPHQLRDPRLPEWGLPVRISVPEALGLKPGELVDVSFKPGQVGSLPIRTAGASPDRGEVGDVVMTASGGGTP